MVLVSASVIAVWPWSLLRDTAGVLLDTRESYLEDDIRKFVEHPGDVMITDLQVWRTEPSAHAAIVAVKGSNGNTARSLLQGGTKSSLSLLSTGFEDTARPCHILGGRRL
jgi:Co/Zn/Cd efflux system component